ncbi:hypothetical protein AVEN_184063-1 [Araneus ventricosus]|uniref:Uncharacterized protein n=1 Tax=Araneus ventricosus TaxID=182803 RepID=A0A4Y2CY07_ARAVE|nr:hypothetical protein AVEN_184063-1 [Araneus ventricosus]
MMCAEYHSPSNCLFIRSSTPLFYGYRNLNDGKEKVQLYSFLICSLVVQVIGSGGPSLAGGEAVWIRLERVDKQTIPGAIRKFHPGVLALSFLSFLPSRFMGDSV